MTAPEAASAPLLRVEALVAGVEALPEASREAARALVDAVLEVHAAALEQALDAVEEAQGHEALLALAGREPLAAVLLLHGMHPVPLEERLARALERARPALRQHGGDVELLEVRPDGVRLRLTGACQGCPSSLATLRGRLEAEVEALAPDAPPLEVEGLAATQARGAAAGDALVCPERSS